MTGLTTNMNMPNTSIKLVEINEHSTKPKAICWAEVFELKGALKATLHWTARNTNSFTLVNYHRKHGIILSALKAADIVGKHSGNSDGHASVMMYVGTMLL